MSKLINCKACGNEISKGAKCPNCGKDSRGWFAKHKILSVLGIVVILGVVGSNAGNKDTKQTTSNKTKTEQKGETKKAPEKEVISVGYSDMAKAFKENEAKGNQLYKDKQIKVTGKIDRIEQTMGSYHISVGTGDENNIDLEGAVCFMDKSQEGIIAELKVGQDIVIEGKCIGRTPVGNGGQLSDCKIVK